MQSSWFPQSEVPPLNRREGGGIIDGKRKLEHFEYFVFEIDFMVKLLRACVWMPWRKEAMKDVVSCDKPREDANSL
jgi:hypothetical protein